jgi:hypothetical protein
VLTDPREQYRREPQADERCQRQVDLPERHAAEHARGSSHAPGTSAATSMCQAIGSPSNIPRRVRVPSRSFDERS